MRFDAACKQYASELWGVGLDGSPSHSLFLVQAEWRHAPRPERIVSRAHTYVSMRASVDYRHWWQIPLLIAICRGYANDRAGMEAAYPELSALCGWAENRRILFRLLCQIGPAWAECRIESPGIKVSDFCRDWWHVFGGRKFPICHLPIVTDY